jgi:hypothetical protein
MMGERGSGRGPQDNSVLGADPFARIADALPEEPVSKLKRPKRRSPSFSDLAPVLPPTPLSPPVAQTPAVVVNPVVNPVRMAGPNGETSPSEPPRITPLPFLPSVIVSEEALPSFSVSRAQASDDGPTTWRAGRRREAPPPRALSTATVLFLLAISVTVFGVGVAALMYTRSTDAPGRAPRVNAADLPPPAEPRP